MNFERSIENIDKIIEKLSEGSVPLEEAIELYKSGVDQLSECKKQLDEAERSVMKISEAVDL